MTDLAKRIYENQEEYNRLFIELASKFKNEDEKGSLISTRSSEIDNLLKSISVVRSNLEVLKGIEAYLAEEEKKVYRRG